MAKPEIIVDGVWLSALMPWGDLEWSTCWPGGTESISFGVARPHHLFRTDAIVELDYGGIRRALGAMTEPTRGEPILVEGLHRKAEDEPALDGSGNISVNVQDAFNQAVIRGLPLAGSAHDLNPIPGVWGAPALDLNQPHSLAEYLDASTQERKQSGWGVDPRTRLAFMADYEPVSLHMLPGIDGLAISRDGYASTLHGRYLSSADGTYKTVTAHDSAAEARWGRVPRLVNELLAEGASISASTAQALLDGLLAQGRSQMGWAVPLEAQFGDVVNAYGQPVDLRRIHARQTIRVHGLSIDAADLSGRSWVDVPIARTRHKDGTVIIEPRGLSSPMNDALAGLSA